MKSSPPPLATKRAMDVVAPAQSRANAISRPPRFRKVRRVVYRYRKPLLTLVAAAVLLTAVLIGGHLTLWSSPAPLTELQQVEQQVGRHYLLPQNETPALATVTDETQLSSPFLKQARNGDKLLIYANAKVVIIYRPGIDRIVAVGPVEFSNPSSNQ